MTKYTKVALRACQEAGAVVMKYFGRKKSLDIRKKKISIVTQVDILSERVIIQHIKKEFPGHAILSEEKGFIRGTTPYQWVIDPIDGTSNFVIGSPYFGVMVNLLHGTDVVNAVIYLPFFRTIIHAEKKSGAFINGKGVHVSNTPSLGESIISLSAMHKIQPIRTVLKGYDHLFPKVRNIRMFGSAAIGHYFLVCGTIEATAIAAPTTLWDVAAGVLITEEAGGKVTDWQGRPWTVKSHNFVASNKLIHRPLIEELKGLE